MTTLRAQLFPNQQLWRSFVFGKHLELMMTDLRSFRADHPVPEDAFPGTVTATQDTLVALLGQAAFDQNFPTNAHRVHRRRPAGAGGPQVDPGGRGDGRRGAGGPLARRCLRLGAAGHPRKAGGAGGEPDARRRQQRPIPADGLERGLFYALIGKQSFFSQYGSRYVVVKSSYDLYTALLYARTAKASENAFGTEQESFIVDKLTKSTATHKALISSVSLVSMQLNLTGIPGVPPEFARAFYFDVDQWDGFPNKRAELLARLAGVQNLVALSGDIHGTFAGNESATSPKIALLTAPAISSQTVGEEVGAAVTTFSPDPAFQPGGAVYRGARQRAAASVPGEHRRSHQVRRHVLPRLPQAQRRAVPDPRDVFALIPASEVTVDYSKQPAGALQAKVTLVEFGVAGGAITS